MINGAKIIPKSSRESSLANGAQTVREVSLFNRVVLTEKHLITLLCSGSGDPELASK
jgi:hypothetical protein